MQTQTSAPAAVHATAARALLRVLARESIQAYARGVLAARGASAAADVVFRAEVYSARSGRREQHRLVVRPSDAAVPSHAAHFRAAAAGKALGACVHPLGCAPPEASSSLAQLPLLPRQVLGQQQQQQQQQQQSFVALYSCGSGRCGSDLLALPEADTVYGEYTHVHNTCAQQRLNDTDTAVNTAAVDTRAACYPVGTVLLSPRAVPSTLSMSKRSGAHDTPWFIVFKPCPTALLRGAVPVGRVVSCVPGAVVPGAVAGAEATAHDGGENNALLDADMLRCLEDMCAAEQQCSDTETRSLFTFDSFR